MKQRPAACEGCPAHATARGFVPPSGPLDAVMALVGQGPGADEAAFGEPFIGESGRRLNMWCVRAEVPRERCAVGNVVWCQLPGNREPKPAEAQHCWRAHVRPWLESLHAVRVVVAIGKPAMQVFLGRKATTSLAGTLHNAPLPWASEAYGYKADEMHRVSASNEGERDSVPDMPSTASTASESLPQSSDMVGVRAHDRDDPPRDDVGVRARSVIVAPLLHPSFIIRGQFAQEPAQADYLRRAWRVARGLEAPPPSDVTQPPPGAIPTPTTHDLRRWIYDTRADDVLACDIEGYGGRLIGIGFARVRDEATLYVPVLDGEAPYWSDADWPGVDEFIRAMLDRPLVFHNGQAFDIPFLAEVGYPVDPARYVDDTMIRHHTLYAEQPKDLESLAIRYLGFQSWKWLSNVKGGDAK